MILSLAGLRYCRAFQGDQGPIARLESGKVTVGGRNWHQVNAYLADELRPPKDNTLYANADGTGADPTEIVAVHKAISEAMERWAYYETVVSPDASLYGFDMDPTTNGMAAFPGLFARQARKAAWLEGIERAAILAWWEGFLDGRLIETDWPGISAVILKPPGGGFVAITFSRTPCGTHAIGHGADVTISGACMKGMIEMGRHDRVVRRFLARPIGTPKPTNILESRALFFASKAGFALFSKRLRTPARARVGHFETICDREIPGPWSQYASVWRVAFRPLSNGFISADEDYFYW
jgi:hypothetical protein